MVTAGLLGGMWALALALGGTGAAEAGAVTPGDGILVVELRAAGAPSASDAARASRALGEAGRWIPPPSALLGLVAVGGPAPGPCPGEGGLADQLAWAGDRLLNLDPPGALEALRVARARVPCEGAILPEEAAWELLLLEGVAHVYAGDGLEGPSLADAAAVSPQRSASDRFDPRVSEALDAARGALAEVAPTPAAAPPPGVELFVDGRPLAAGEGLRPGRHVVQARGPSVPGVGAALRGAVVTIPAGGGSVDLGEALDLAPPGALADGLSVACAGGELDPAARAALDGWLLLEGRGRAALAIPGGPEDGGLALWEHQLGGPSRPLVGCAAAARRGPSLWVEAGPLARALPMSGAGAAPRGSGLGYRLEAGVGVRRAGASVAVGVLPHPVGGGACLSCGEGFDPHSLSGDLPVDLEVAAALSLGAGRWRLRPSAGARALIQPDVVDVREGGWSVATRVMVGPAARLSLSRRLGAGPLALGLSLGGGAALAPGLDGRWRAAWPLEAGAWVGAGRSGG